MIRKVGYGPLARTASVESDQVRCIAEGGSKPNVDIGYAIKPPQHQYRDLTSKSEFPEQN
jgi:hypothetical protein